MGYWGNTLRTELKDFEYQGVLFDDSEGEEFVGLLFAHIVTGERKIMWLLRDEEGNGAGRFEFVPFDPDRVESEEIL